KTSIAKRLASLAASGTVSPLAVSLPVSLLIPVPANEHRPCCGWGSEPLTVNGRQGHLCFELPAAARRDYADPRPILAQIPQALGDSCLAAVSFFGLPEAPRP